VPTTEDLKVHNNQTSSVDDNELQDHLDAAVEVVEGLIGPIQQDTVTETHRGVRSDVIVLRRMPVAELVSVAARYGISSTPLTLSDFELDVDTGIVRAASGAGFYGDFTVSYGVGYDILPAAVRLAVLIVAEHFWETQRGTAPTALKLQQGDVVDSGTFGSSFAIPNRAQELLAAYVRPSIA
jgi:hypothetical protein